jgi:hypothetical protein
LCRGPRCCCCAAIGTDLRASSGRKGQPLQQPRPPQGPTRCQAADPPRGQTPTAVLASPLTLLRASSLGLRSCDRRWGRRRSRPANPGDRRDDQDQPGTEDEAQRHGYRTARRKVRPDHALGSQHRQARIGDGPGRTGEGWAVGQASPWVEARVCDWATERTVGRQGDGRCQLERRNARDQSDHAGQGQPAYRKPMSSDDASPPLGSFSPSSGTAGNEAIVDPGETNGTSRAPRARETSSERPRGSDSCRAERGSG